VKSDEDGDEEEIAGDTVRRRGAGGSTFSSPGMKRRSLRIFRRSDRDARAGLISASGCVRAALLVQRKFTSRAEARASALALSVR